MSHKELSYFDIRGRGEIIRLVLAATNETYDDKRIVKENWPTMKPTLTYGQLPVLKLEDGKQMNESLAIARYIARHGKLYGKNDWEMYLVDRAIDTMYDLLTKSIQVHFESNATKKEELTKDLHDKHIPTYLGNLTKYIEEAKGDFITGCAPTLGDLAIIVILDILPETKAKFPKLDNAYKKTIDALPGLKKYLSTRKETPI